MYRLITVSDRVRVRSGPGGMCSNAERPIRAASLGSEAANMALASCARIVVRRGSSTDMSSAHFENHRADTSGADRAVTHPRLEQHVDRHRISMIGTFAELRRQLGDVDGYAGIALTLQVLGDDAVDSTPFPGPMSS